MPRDKTELDLKHHRAIEILRGTNGSFGASVFITLASAALITKVLHGLVYPADQLKAGIQPHAALYVGQSCVFLTSQTFFQAKTVRDGFTAALPNAPEGAQFMKGSLAWQLGVVVAVVVALLFLLHSLYMLLDLPSAVAFEPFFVLCLSTFFLVASSANLAKIVRDRSDATLWEHVEDSTETVFELVKGTNANTLLVFGSFTVAVLSIATGVIFFTGLSIETRGFLLMGATFLLMSAFSLSKTVRDSATPAGSPLQPKAKDWALAINSMIISSVMVFGGLFVYMTSGVISFNESLFFATAYFFALFTTSWVSKWMRDRVEIHELKSGQYKKDDDNNRPEPSAPRKGKAL